MAARSLCRLLRTTGVTSPMFAILTEGGLVALTAEWGIDDVLLDSAGPAEVDARLRLAMGRRHADEPPTTQSERGVIRAGDVTVDEHAYTAKLNGKALDLTFKEFELLKFLAQHPGRVFSRAQLLQEVWGYDYYGGTRTVDVHVRRLRAKLGPEHEAMIGTVRNVGYKFVRQPTSVAETEATETVEVVDLSTRQHRLTHHSLCAASRVNRRHSTASSTSIEGAEMLVRVQVLGLLMATATTTACAQVSQGAQSTPPASAMPSASAGLASVGPTPTSSASSAASRSASSSPSAAASPAPKSSAPQAISWLDQPVPKVVPPDFDPDITHPVLYRPCTGADVTARPKGWGAGMGTMAEFIYLTNSSSTPCTLAGSATAVIGIDGPHEHTFPLSPGGMGHPPDTVANLKPGQTGWMQITQGEDCATDPKALVTSRSASCCPAAASSRWWPSGTRPRRPAASSASPRSARPTSRRPSRPTRPTRSRRPSPPRPPYGRASPSTTPVTLTNPTAKPISLTPCPSYEEVAFRKPDPHPDDQTYQLNCDGHRELSPHESLTFAMHTAGIGPTGQGQIIWRLQHSNTIASDWDITVS